MTNWQQIFETNVIFNMILRKITDEFPDVDIKIDLQINHSTHEIYCRFTPGHEWLLSFNKSGLRKKNISLGWQFRLKRKSMIRLVFGETAHWVIHASVINKVYVNEQGPEAYQIITESWK